jgi:cell division protein FtsL
MGGGCGSLIFFGVVVLMRWLVIVLLVSLVALLLVAAAVARHVWRHRQLMAEDSANLDAQKAQNIELDRALDLHAETEADQLVEVKDTLPKEH